MHTTRRIYNVIANDAFWVLPPLAFFAVIWAVLFGGSPQ